MAFREFIECNTLKMEESIASAVHAVTEDGVGVVFGDGRETRVAQVDFVVVVVVGFGEVARRDGKFLEEVAEHRVKFP